MTDAVPTEEATLFPKTAGERLREAREAQGLSLAEIAARTRVPVRQLEAIEASNFAALPSITYSVGFAKAYARAVGIDEVSIGNAVRSHEIQPAPMRRTEYETYAEDEAMARTPTRGLAIGALLVALLVVVAGGLFFGTNLFRDGEESAPVAAPSAATQVPEAPVASPPAAATPAGPVVLTATDEVWLRVYDSANKTLRLGTLKPGETYTVPADAAGPMINVGRPDKLQVTVGGTAVAPLGDGRVAIKDVPVSAAALTARGAPAPAASPTAAATSATGSRPTARPTPQSRPTPTATETPARDRAATPPASAPLNIAAPADAKPAPASTATPTP